MVLPLDVFFYGLYMDESVLRAAGVTPRVPRKARADGFALRIGKRATLVRAPGRSAAWGIVYAADAGGAQSGVRGGAEGPC